MPTFVLEKNLPDRGTDLYYTDSIILNPSKKVMQFKLRGNISLVASSSYVNMVSLESLIINLYNDVSFVMLMQSWNAQSI